MLQLQDDVTDVPLNIAVTGASGAGKSTLVNTMRGLYGNDDGAAPVGVLETTHEPQKYRHPEHKNFVLWDLPGVGTTYFPQHSYLEQIEVERYDFFLILSAGRFRENDIWLAEQLEDFGKPYYFVRTKVNIDIQNDSEDNPGSNSAESVISKLKQEYRQNMYMNNIRGQIFVISGKKKHDTLWEYPKLVESIIRDLPKLKQHKVILSSAAISKNTIQRKCTILENRILKAAALSAAAAAIPFPGVSLTADIALLVEEVHYYKKTLELDHDSLWRLGRELNIPMRAIEDLLSDVMPSVALSNVEKFVLDQLAQYAVGKVAAEVAHYIPVLGTVVSSVISFKTTSNALNACLRQLKQGALMILEEKVRQSTMDVMNA